MKTLRTLLAAMLTLVFATPLWAQSVVDRADPVIANPDFAPPPAAAPADQAVAVEAASPDVNTADIGAVIVGGVKVTGTTQLPPETFAAAVTPWLGQALTPKDLRALATAIADAARQRGFLFARASIPRQTIVNGIISVELDEGRIDQVRLEGGLGLGLDPLFAPLANGEPVDRRRLETAIYTARDRHGITIGTARVRREAGRAVLIIPVSRKRFSGQAYIDNRGTSALGPLRAQLSFDFADLIGTGDMLSLAGAVTPTQPREFGLVSARYARSAGTHGPVIGVSGYYAHSRASGALRALGAEGKNYELALDAIQPLARGRTFSASLLADVAVRRSMLSGDDDLRLRRDRVSVATLGLQVASLFAGGAARVETSVSVGLDIFDATRRGEPAASRPHASGRFVTWNASVVWARALSPRWTLRATGDVQLADRPLLVGEQFGLGGARLLRGYDYGERLGDEGASGGVEVSWTPAKAPASLNSFELFAFGDAGKVRDKDGGYRASLASAGGGLRVGKGPVRGAIEAAVPLTGRRFDSNDRGPRLSFSLAALF